MNVEKYQWLVAYSAPKYHPMQLYMAYLTLESEEVIPCAYMGVLNDGLSGSDNTDNGGMRSIPKHLDITFASHIEGKFYSGAWDLPLEKIREIFKNGMLYWRSNKPVYEYDIVIGMAPGGLVIVYIYSNNQQIEIARFKAKQIEDIPMSEFLPTNPTLSKEEYFKIDDSATIEYQKKHGLRLDLWDIYGEKYLWRPKIEIKNSIFRDIMMDMFNGELEVLFAKSITENKYKYRAIPVRLTYTWAEIKQRSPFKKNDRTVLEFENIDEEEIFNIFKKLDKDKPIDIILKMEDDLTKRELIIQQGDKKYNLYKLDFENMWTNKPLKYDN